MLLYKVASFVVIDFENGVDYISFSVFDFSALKNGTEYSFVNDQFQVNDYTDVTFIKDKSGTAYTEATLDAFISTIKVIDDPNIGNLPAGGTTGQILAKIDGTDYNAEWIDNLLDEVNPVCKLGENISKGQAVYISGADGINKVIKKASNATELTSSKTFGLLSASGVTNDKIRVITLGYLSGLDTSSANEGDPVWLGVNGNLIYGIANKPHAPAHLVFIGFVVRKNNVNGQIYVRVQNGFELDELHDVKIQSPANKNTIFYNSSNSLWENRLIGIADVTDLESALSGKEPTINAGTTSQYWRGDKSWQTLDKSAVGLGNVDNTSDLNKPISTATQTALNAKQDSATAINTGNIASQSVAFAANAGLLDGYDSTYFYPSSNPNGYTNNVGTVTSVGVSAPTGFSVSNSPVTNSGTIGISFASGYSLPTNASQSNWNEAYNDKINSVSVTGTTVKLLTLTQQDGGTLTTSWTDINTDAVSSVFGRTGAVVAVSGDYNTSQVTENTNLYYTEARVNANANVAANTAARHNAVTLGTANGLILSTQQLSLGLSSGSTTGALSSTDWNTFNNKQNALTNPVTGAGTTNRVPKFTGATTIVDSQIFDNGTNVGIGTTNPLSKLNATNTYYSGTPTKANSAAFFDNQGVGVYIGGNEYSYGYIQAEQSDNTNIKSLVLQPNSGNVGIGTNNPSRQLQVKGEISSYYGSNGGTLWLGEVVQQEASFTSFGVLDYTLHNGGGYSHIMRVQGNGNVGIGTTNPQAKLDVLNKVLIGEDLTFGGYYGIGWGSLQNGYNRIFAQSLGGSGDGLFLASASGKGIYFRPNGGSTDALTIAANNYIGINTTAPSYPIHLNNPASETGILTSFGSANIYLSHGGWGMGANKFGIGNGSFPSIVVNGSNENVGIGTTNPIWKFVVSKGGAAGLEIDPDNGTAGKIGIYAYNRSTRSYVPISFEASSYFLNVGSVAIGTSTIDSSAILQLESSTKGFLPPRMNDAEMNAISSPATGLMVWNNDSVSLFVFDGGSWRKIAYA